MKDIAKQLAELEKTAQAIVDNAEIKKHDLEEKYQKDRNHLDEHINKETQETINILDDEIREKMEKEIAEKRDENDAVIAHMRKEYEEHHTEYAKGILNRIVEV